MTQAIAQIIEQIERLPESEKAEFRDIFIRDYLDPNMLGEITDEDIHESGRRSFQRLDEEENATELSSKR